jgi:formylglycine-generating enzyme required for sulfatase activity
VTGRFWTVVALALAATTAAAEAPRPLAWRFKEKDQFYAEWTFLHLVKSRMNQLGSESMEDARLVAHFTVLEEKADGGAVLQMQIELSRVRAMGKAVPQLPQRLEGTSVRITLDGDQAVTRVDGVEDVLAHLAVPAGLELKPLQEGVEAQLRFWLDHIFYRLPGRPVAEGQSWRQRSDNPAPGEGVEKRARTFTLCGEERVDGRRLQKITFTTHSRFAFEGPEDPGILNRRPRPEITRQDQKGTLYYDPATGRLTGGTAREVLQAEGSGRLRGEALDMGIEVHIATTLRLTDRDPLAAVARIATKPATGGAEEQEPAADRAGPTVTNSLGMKLVLVPAGTCTMGSPPGQAGRSEWEEEHEVEVTRPLYMGAHEVTIGQYRRFVAATGYRTDAEKNGKGGFGYDPETGKLEVDPRFSWRHPGWEVTDEHPAVNLSWQDCKAFCDWLAKKEGKAYRLPTEAEWEYACRAGTTTRYSSGDDPETLARVGNVADASAAKLFPQWQTLRADDHFAFTAPVGSFRPNAFGLYDMHGNALEWCEDWLWYVNPEQRKDPQGAPFGVLRVQRGGSWADFPYQSTSARRSGLGPDNYCISSGFRVVMPAEEK